ncbi:nuclear transport factor 2 family protein [Nocardia sp. NPDC050793]|uniref:nuclear transport factor 2 family protein n=1 Tax=Nocardia sp. NPDC050793 TaxID=3155159 RepID=UPI0033D01984
MTDENKAVVQDMWRAFAEQDFDCFADFFTDDAEWLAPAANATAITLEVSSHMTGRTAIADYFADDFPRLFVEDVAITHHGVYAEGDRVIVEHTMSATLANGDPYVNDYCFVFELRDGRIHRVREYLDTSRGYEMIYREVAEGEIPESAPMSVVEDIHLECACEAGGPGAYCAPARTDN